MHKQGFRKIYSKTDSRDVLAETGRWPKNRQGSLDSVTKASRQNVSYIYTQRH